MIFITGATGFIGSRVLQALIEKNEKICILSRKKINPNLPIEIVNANLEKVEDYKDYLKKAEILLHIAGCAKAFSKNKDEFYLINYLATKKIIMQALEFEIKKIIYLSTCMVFGPSNTELSEDDFKERNNFLTDYEKSKYLAERFVRSKIKEKAPIIVLYPTRVFGQGKLTQGNSVSKLILFFMRTKIFPVIENPSYFGNYVYVDDVVNIILKTIYEVKPPQTFLVGGYNLNFRMFFEVLNNLLNYNCKIVIIGKAVAMQVARFFENLETTTGIPAMISRGWVKTFTTNWLFSNQKVEKILSYKFTSFENALKETVNWLKNLHL